MPQHEANAKDLIRKTGAVMHWRKVLTKQNDTSTGCAAQCCHLLNSVLNSAEYPRGLLR